jgi:tetratricopeptide (TPR) repeat protein
MSNYIFGTSLSYIDYLQARSFENSLKMEVSQQSRAIIASNEQLQLKHISVSTSSNQVMSEGFEGLSFDLKRLNEGVAELTAAFDWGFSELLAKMGQVNDALADLIRLTKTPAQTWAYEQFEIAREAFRKRLYPEALEYLARAINGFASNTGYKLEYRFHYLLGTIRLGGFKNSSKDVVDLGAAESAFLATARYSRGAQPGEAGRAMLAAGWAAYCQGKMEEAKEYTNQAISLSPGLGEAYFQLAKVQMHMGEVANALTPLQRAIELDRLYSIKAASDGDFLAHQDKLDDLLARLRDESQQKAEAMLRSVRQELESAEAFIVAEYSLKNYTNTADAKHVLDEAHSAARSKTYFGSLDCIEMCERATIKLHEAISDFVRRARAANQSKIDEVDQRLNRVSNGDLATDSVGYFFLGSVLLGVIICCVQCNSMLSMTPTNSLATCGELIATIFYASVFCAMVTFIIHFVRKDNILRNGRREKERLTAIDSDLAKSSR